MLFADDFVRVSDSKESLQKHVRRCCTYIYSPLLGGCYVYNGTINLP